MNLKALIVAAAISSAFANTVYCQDKPAPATDFATNSSKPGQSQPQTPSTASSLPASGSPAAKDSEGSPIPPADLRQPAANGINESKLANSDAQSAGKKGDLPLHSGRTEAISNIVSKDKAIGYYLRLNAASKLSRHLSTADQDALFHFLSEHHDSQWSFLAPLEFNAIKNEIVIQLSRQQSAGLCQELGQRMIDMMADKSYDEIWRNYCAQFMGQLYKAMNAEQRTLCVKQLYGVVDDTPSSLPGTALLSLKRINSFEPQAVSKDGLAKKAFGVIILKEAREINKITALQVCAQLNFMEALPQARNLVADTQNSVSLRISAIAAVGLLGDSADKTMLEPLSKSSDTRLATAASAALKRIDSRQTKPVEGKS